MQPNVPMQAIGLQGVADSLIMDDARTEAILRERITMPDKKWKKVSQFGLFVGAEEAVSLGFADEIGDFAPPAGSNVINVLGDPT